MELGEVLQSMISRMRSKSPFFQEKVYSRQTKFTYLRKNIKFASFTFRLKEGSKGELSIYLVKKMD